MAEAETFKYSEARSLPDLITHDIERSRPNVPVVTHPNSRDSQNYAPRSGLPSSQNYQKNDRPYVERFVYMVESGAGKGARGRIWPRVYRVEHGGNMVAPPIPSLPGRIIQNYDGLLGAKFQKKKKQGNHTKPSVRHIEHISFIQQNKPNCLHLQNSKSKSITSKQCRMNTNAQSNPKHTFDRIHKYES